jgi:hypothetical protein
LEEGQIVGTIHNTSGTLLSDAVLLLGSDILRLGDIKPGQSVPVELKLTADLNDKMYGAPLSWRIFESEYSGGIGPPPQDIEFKRMVIEATVDQQFYKFTPAVPMQAETAAELDASNEVLLLGWLEGSPPEVQVNGQIPQQQGVTLLLAHLPYNFPAHGEIRIPPGLIPGVITELPISAGPCGNSGTALWFNGGQAVFEYLVPPEINDIQLQNLLVTIHTDGAWTNLPTLEIYDWEANDWGFLEAAPTSLTEVPNPDPFVSSAGLVRLRLSLDNPIAGGGGFCIYTGLGIEGSR